MLLLTRKSRCSVLMNRLRTSGTGWLAILIAVVIVLSSIMGVASFQPAQSSGQVAPSSSCFPDDYPGYGPDAQLTTTLNASMLKAAETSSQFLAFENMTGGTPILVTPGPAMEVGQTPGCQGAIIAAFTYNFISGGKQIAIGVNPATKTVVRSSIAPAVHGWSA